MKSLPSPPSRSWLALSLGAILFFLMLGCQGQNAPGEASGEETPAENNDSLAFSSETLMDVVWSDARFSTFSAAIDSAGLADVLREDGPYTLFAPTNEAFEALPPGVLEGLWEDAPRLREVFAYHIGDGRYRLNDLHGTDSLTTLSGRPLAVQSSDNTVMVGDASILEADVLSDNGLLHVVDAVLFPLEE